MARPAAEQQMRRTGLLAAMSKECRTVHMRMSKPDVPHTNTAPAAINAAANPRIVHTYMMSAHHRAFLSLYVEAMGWERRIVEDVRYTTRSRPISNPTVTVLGSRNDTKHRRKLTQSSTFSCTTQGYPRTCHNINFLLKRPLSILFVSLYLLSTVANVA